MLSVGSAYQWFRNGDHPADRVGRTVQDSFTGELYEKLEGEVVRYYRSPDVSGNSRCPKCRKYMDDHGWIDSGTENGEMVCPGDWVVEIDGEYHSCPAALYEALFGAS